MKNLTKLSLLAAGLAVVALPTFAADNAPADQPAQHAHPRAHAMLQRRAAMRAHALKRLDLTDAQKQQLKSQRESTKSALKALRADASLTKEQKREKARELVATARTNFRNALTPEQQAKLDQMRAKLRHRRGN